MTNSADPDQLASSEANWSGSTLFAKAGIFGFTRTMVNSDKTVQAKAQKISCTGQGIFKSLTYHLGIADTVRHLKRSLAMRMTGRTDPAQLKHSHFLRFSCTNLLISSTVASCFCSSTAGGLSLSSSDFSLAVSSAANCLSLSSLDFCFSTLPAVNKTNAFSHKFESAMVNEPSVFELLFDFIIPQVETNLILALRMWAFEVSNWGEAIKG